MWVSLSVLSSSYLLCVFSRPPVNTGVINEVLSVMIFAQELLLGVY